MTLKTFVKTIRQSGNFRGNQDTVSIEIFEAAGVHNFSDSAIISWVKGTRTPNFSEADLNKDSFIKYFDNRTESTWPDMKKAFENLDEYGIIDSDNKKKEDFFNDLYYLFLELLRIPWTKKSSNSVLMRKMFEKAVDDYRIVSCIRSKYSKSRNNSDNFEIIDDGFNIHIKLPTTIDDFVEYVKSNVLDRFVSSQEENTYKNITRFIEILGNYNSEFGFLRSTDSPEMKNCFSLLQSNLSENDFMSKVDIEKDKLVNEKNRMISDGDDVRLDNRLKSDLNWIPDYEELRVSWIDFEISSIDSIKTIYLNRTLLNSLYSEICDGKTLFVY